MLFIDNSKSKAFTAKSNSYFGQKFLFWTWGENKEK